jgi:hypothetical protein
MYLVSPSKHKKIVFSVSDGSQVTAEQHERPRGSPGKKDAVPKTEKQKKKQEPP